MQIKHHLAGGTNNWPYASMNSKNLDVDISLNLGLRLSCRCYIFKINKWTDKNLSTSNPKFFGHSRYLPWAVYKLNSRSLYFSSFQPLDVFAYIGYPKDFFPPIRLHFLFEMLHKELPLALIAMFQHSFNNIHTLKTMCS